MTSKLKRGSRYKKKTNPNELVVLKKARKVRADFTMEQLCISFEKQLPTNVIRDKS